tara:strand:+ start:199 stop:666 length:468 start_codon:yes stop_codon:yes gene_type:complete
MATSAEFWESSTYGPGDSNATYEFSNARSPNRYHLMRLLRKRGMRNYGEIISTLLTDASPSTSASVTTTQVDHTVDLNANNFGGARTTTANETMDLTINSDKDDASANTARAVTSADVTALQTEVIPSGSRANRAPATYPTDASGNGGGGKGETI